MPYYPTATQYARNALFAGMMPRDIQQMFPSQWKNEDEEGSKNNFEESFLSSQLKREGLNLRMSYNKVLNMKFGRKIAENFANLLNNDLNVIVYNFVICCHMPEQRWKLSVSLPMMRRLTGLSLFHGLSILHLATF